MKYFFSNCINVPIEASTVWIKKAIFQIQTSEKFSQRFTCSTIHLVSALLQMDSIHFSPPILYKTAHNNKEGKKKKKLSRATTPQKRTKQPIWNLSKSTEGFSDLKKLSKECEYL